MAFAVSDVGVSGKEGVVGEGSEDAGVMCQGAVDVGSPELLAIGVVAALVVADASLASLVRSCDRLGIATRRPLLLVPMMTFSVIPLVITPLKLSLVSSKGSDGVTKPVPTPNPRPKGSKMDSRASLTRRCREERAAS